MNYMGVTRGKLGIYGFFSLAIPAAIIFAELLSVAGAAVPEDPSPIFLWSETAEIGDVLRVIATLERISIDEEGDYCYYRVRVELVDKGPPANSLRTITKMWAFGEDGAELLSYAPSNQPPGPTVSTVVSTVSIPPTLRDLLELYGSLRRENPGAWIVEQRDCGSEEHLPWTCHEVDWSTNFELSYCWHPALETNSVWRVQNNAVGVVAEIFAFVIPSRVGTCSWKIDKGNWCALDEPILLNLKERDPRESN